MPHKLNRCSLAVCFVLFLPLVIGAQPAPEEIEKQLASKDGKIKQFYELQQFRPVWIFDSSLRPIAKEAFELLRTDAALEFPGADYKLNGLESSFNSGKEPGVSDEIQLTESMLMFVQHRLNGRVNPSKLHRDWNLQKEMMNPADILHESIRSGSIQKYFDEFQLHEGVRALQNALSDYLLIAEKGGWPLIPSGKKLSIGMIDPRIILIRKRLRITADLEDENKGQSDEFDESLDLAIRGFQRRHGLNADGIVGPNTLTELNRTVHERIRQIQVNLERLHWLKADAESRSVVVNIPAFELQVFESGKELLRMRTIVGKVDWCSPVFLSSEITEVILNPYWSVPKVIATKEILKFVQKDPKYLKKNRIRVFSGNVQIDSDTIQWNGISPYDFPFQLRQDPGSGNSLGRIKFHFPNNCGCYLHDTPSKELFERSARAFSHGCIRIEHPLLLASFLLANDPVWTPEKIQQQTEIESQARIPLPEPVPIYIVYFTSWVDADNVLQFRQDVYKEDRKLARAMGLN